MSTSRPLPNVAVLEKLLLGQLPPDEAEALCAQLQDSKQFAVLAQSLIASDTLIEALHAQMTQPTPRPDARLEGLMARLCELRPDLSGADADRTAALDPASARTPITFLSPAQQADELGRLGEYRVLKVLGQGGMGVVFLAEDVRLGRCIALKTMRPEAAQLANAKQRFIREARTTAAIEHDHIVPIYQVGEENGVPFLAMPFLRGEPLDERLKRAEGKPMPVREIVRIGREIAEGLSAAHEQGLIHRDIKPANVWLETPHGERGASAPCSRVKILDFGLARAVREDTQLTQSGAIVGTPAYMAPEQARGEAVDARCDLFGLGCILYQMSTGQKPFNGPDTMSILMSLALDQPPPPRRRNAELPAELSDLITRLLAKKPEDRPASARAVADALAAIERGLCDTTLVQTASVAPIVTMPKPARRRQRLAVAVAAAMLLIGGAIAAVVIIRDKQGKEVARVNVPQDGSVEVKPDDKQRPPEKEKQPSVAIPADPLPKIEPGTPLGLLALVTNPAPLPGVRSWTIETRIPRGTIHAVAYRPDGRMLATAGDDGVIRLLDARTGLVVRALVGHMGRITLLAWSQDGRTLASGSWDGTVRLWDADSGRWLRTLTGLEQFWALAWSVDGRSIMGYENSNVLTWDTANGKTISKLTLSKGVSRPAFSPDGKFMASESEDHLVRIWETRTGREVRTLKGHTAAVQKIAWSPDGKRLASTGGDAVRLWETETGKEVRKHSSPNGFYEMLAWSPDGRTLVLCEATGIHAQLDVMPVDNSVPLRTIRACIKPFGVSWSPDGKTVASGGPYGDVAITDIESGAKTELHPGPANSQLTGLAWSPDSKQLAAATYQTGLRVVNPTTGEATSPLIDTGRIIAWSPSKWLAITGWERETQLSLWQPGGERRILPAHKSGWVGALAWSPDGKTLADAGRESGTLRLWDGETRQLKRQWDASRGIDALSWSPDGKLLAAGIEERVKFWHNDTGKELRTLPGFNEVAWPPVGETLAVYQGNGSNLRLFNVKTGELGLTLPSGGVQNVAWSPDGKLLAVACTGKEGQGSLLFIPVWAVGTGDEVRKLDRVCLRGQNNPLVWSPDGKRIAACAAQTIQLWDANTGKSEGVILPNPQFHGLTIRPDGHYRGNAKVDEAIVMVVQKEDGSTETLSPAEFARKYNWKNEK